MDDIRLLIAESNPDIISSVKDCIDTECYYIDLVPNGIAAIKSFRRNSYDLVIIDSHLPELDGYNVCYQIRKVSDIPIIIISSMKKETDKLSFYKIGADDFLVKPISMPELMAKIKVLLRRTVGLKSISPRIILVDQIHIDTVSRVVYIDDKEIQLTPKEYELLLYLSQNPNRALSREVLLNEVWGVDFIGSDRTVDTHIKTLRDSLKPYHQCISTVWGYGYKLELL
ncbi:MAG: response regulator transcription factor [Oscillospiraceae bacterium]|nr:response regulator transcription factor [Oscillospiraceae bacterium]MDD4413536.1 response regulator transcription factor [Oscillospiraceae bacterium]